MFFFSPLIFIPKNNKIKDRKMIVIFSIVMTITIILLVSGIVLFVKNKREAENKLLRGAEQSGEELEGCEVEENKRTKGKKIERNSKGESIIEHASTCWMGRFTKEDMNEIDKIEKEVEDESSDEIFLRENGELNIKRSPVPVRMQMHLDTLKSKKKTTTKPKTNTEDNLCKYSKKNKNKMMLSYKKNASLNVDFKILCNQNKNTNVIDNSSISPHSSASPSNNSPIDEEEMEDLIFALIENKSQHFQKISPKFLKHDFSKLTTIKNINKKKINNNNNINLNDDEIDGIGQTDSPLDSTDLHQKKFFLDDKNFFFDNLFSLVASFGNIEMFNFLLTSQEMISPTKYCLLNSVIRRDFEFCSFLLSFHFTPFARFYFPHLDKFLPLLIPEIISLPEPFKPLFQVSQIIQGFFIILFYFIIYYLLFIIYYLFYYLFYFLFFIFYFIYLFIYFI